MPDEQVPWPRWQLVPGDPAPAQLDDRTCGPATLTTARMLQDPALVHWVRTGDKGGRAFPDGADVPERLAAYHRLVHRRTNAVIGPTGRVQLPWPQALGTPPWGVCRELEALTGTARGGYRAVFVRGLSPARLTTVLAHLATHLDQRRPGVLYSGSATLPRHVVLLVPGGSPGELVLYDPGSGLVEHLDGDATRDLAAGRHRVGGWPRPWLLIGPTG